MPSASCAMALGWSPAGSNCETTLNSGTAEGYRDPVPNPYRSSVGPVPAARCLAGHPLPGPVDLLLEPRPAARVVDNQVGQSAPLLAAELGCDAGPGVGLRETALGDQAFDGDVLGRVDDDDSGEVETVLRRDVEQGDVEHDDSGQGPGGGNPLGHDSADDRVGDRVEVGEGAAIGEDDGGEDRPVDAPVRTEDRGTEALDYWGEGRSPRLDDLASDGVGVYH